MTFGIYLLGLPLKNKISSYNTCLSFVIYFTCRIAVGRGRAGRPARPRPTSLLPPCSNGKPEVATAVSELLMMGMRMPETC